VLDFILGLARAQALGKAVPEAEKAPAAHLEDAANVRRLIAIEKSEVACVLVYTPSVRSRNPSATSASKKSRAERG
jgi:hypothetical protein